MYNNKVIVANFSTLNIFICLFGYPSVQLFKIEGKKKTNNYIFNFIFTQWALLLLKSFLAIETDKEKIQS